MSEPPNQRNNPYSGPPPHLQQTGSSAGGYNTGAGRPMGAWQPAAPTSLQMAGQGGGQQQQQQPYGQQHPSGYNVQPQMNPYAYNPYAAQQQYQMQPGRGPAQWNPAYANTMYGAPNMYYQQPGRPQSQQIQPPSSGATPVTVPAPRPKKVLVITDKNGNPIDLSSVKKSSAAAPTPAATPAATPTPPPPAPGADAGSKLRQAALERIQGGAEKSKSEVENASKNVVEEAAIAQKIITEPAKTPLVSPTAAPLQQPKEMTALASTKETPSVPDTAPPSVTPAGKRRLVYSKEEMMLLKSLPVCMQRPDDLPDFLIVKVPARVVGGGGDRRQSRNDGGGGGGGGGSWQRGAAPPRRSSTEKPNNGGGSQWARGQAPPPKPQGRGDGGGGGRGGRGFDRGGSGPPFFDGPVAPLVKSTNGWRPVKSASALVVAEKQVKAILNKMTKEKFDRLSANMCEIPVLSYEILAMMIGNVYEKAIDEPTFGDMYGDLCIKLSQQVQTDSFVKIIESDEEPPTENGESSPVTQNEQSSQNLVYRWSNDVGTTDAEIVGPFQSIEECLEVAMSDSEQERIERNEMELELVKLQIKGGMFIKVLKKVGATDAEIEEGEEPEFYTVYFPVADHEACGQQLSKIFLSERECTSDASKQNSFKRSLLNKCEDEFSKQDIYVDWKKEKAAYEESKTVLSESERAEKEEELEFRRIKIKKQMLGNIKFIGQLYKKNLLKEKIMRFCIASLLKLEPDDADAKVRTYHDAGDAEMDEEDHEAICSMFATIGSTIDDASAADFITVCFNKIKRLSTSPDLPSRSRFMYRDLLELRQNNWVPRRTVEKAKTIEEIRKDFELEERLKAQESQQMNFRGGNRPDQGRNDTRRGGDFRSNNRSSLSSGTAPRRQVSKPVVVTDDDGFTTIKSGKSAQVQATFNRDTQRQAPKVITKQAYAALTEETSTPLNADPLPESLSDEKLERRIGTIRGEFLQDPNDIENLMLSMDELVGTPNYGVTFVQKNCDYIIDCRDNERSSVYALHTLLVQKGRLSSVDIKTGMTDLIEFIDSYACDAPRAYDYLGEFLGHMIKANALEVSWVCEQAEQTRTSRDDNPEKIILGLINAMKTSFGSEETKAMIQSCSSDIEKVLGADKWGALRGVL